MRPVSKGSAPRVFNSYRDARHDLAERIGYYCSYCEMATWNMIEVEHVYPINNGGDELEWSNFLLSCRYCNSVKSNDNLDRNDYIWPDRDNSDLVFDYDEVSIISPKPGILVNINQAAGRTINLMGLNRTPGLPNLPTEADTRWRSRFEAWDKANKSLARWRVRPSIEMAEQIAESATVGHYSIWCTVFKDEAQVLTKIRRAYKGTYYECDEGGIRIVRNGGVI